MELFALEISPCFIAIIYVMVIIATIIGIYQRVKKYDKVDSYDEKKYTKLRAEKEQFKVMWVSFGALGTLTNDFSPSVRVFGALLPMLLLGYYYRRLEEFCIRQELKKEELKLNKGKE